MLCWMLRAKVCYINVINFYLIEVCYTAHFCVILQRIYAITEICDILNLNRSSYYNRTHRVKSNRETENEALLHEIGLIYCLPPADYRSLLETA